MGLKGKEAKMKMRLAIIGIIISAFFLLGMGSMDQTDKPGEIPHPDKEVTVNISDVEGQSLNLTRFSLNGQAFLTGKLGAGQVAIPLEQVRVISLSPNGKEVLAKLDMVDGSHLNVQMEKGMTVYGKIKYGTYKITLDRLKKIEILEVKERKKERQ
jgi:hypothetical protein